MEYTTLGKTGLRISRVGFGGIPIQRISCEETRTLMQTVRAAGINFIDTARAYTVSEEWCGAAIEGMRDQFILASKSMARTREQMAADVETSLKNLRTDFIDLYQIHNPNEQQLETVMEPGGALEALLEAKAAGKIRHIGVTAHSLAVFRTALTLPWVETIMFPYNIVETQGEAEIAACLEKNIGFIAMKPLAGGAIEDGRLAMRFICANPAVSVVIPGMYHDDEVAINTAAAADHSPLTVDEQTAIREIREHLGEHFCRRCGYCAPCAAGINIAGVFLFEGYLSRYGLEKWARERYDTLSAKASACIGCGICESRCPYHLPIREMMHRAADAFGE